MFDLSESRGSTSKLDAPPTAGRSWIDALIPRLSTGTLIALLAIGIICALAVVLTPEVRVTIAADQIRAETGKAYVTPISPEAYYLYTFAPDAGDAPSRSRLVLYEDGRALSPPHALHETIRQEGRGAYSHWGNQLYFSSSDGSDPRTNGRTYVAVSPAHLPVALEVVLILASIVCFAVMGLEVTCRHLARVDQKSGVVAPLIGGSGVLIALLMIGIACLLAVVLTPEVRITIAADQMRLESGKAYSTQLPTYRLYAVSSDTVDAASESRLVLYENGLALSPPHSLHETIRRLGRGAYSHWGNQIYFSSSDGTDPRTNGRTYVAVAPTRLPAGLEAILVLASVACFALLRRELKHRYPPARADQKTGFVVPRLNYLSFRASVGLAFAIIAAAAAAAWFSGLQYRTNDDTVMRFIAEGISGDGSATQFLIYQNILVGLFLRTMYGWAPAVPWYDVALATGALSGALLCQIAAFRFCVLRRDFAFCALVGFLFFAPIFQSFQFSASAALLSGGALLTVAALWHRPPKTRAALWSACVLVVLAFALAALVRFRMAILILGIILPMAVLLIAVRRIQWSLLVPAGALACGVLLAVLSQPFQVNYITRSPGWETFVSEWQQRVAATEYAQLDASRPEQFRAALAAARWTENDYLLLSGWFFADRQLFSFERMRSFTALAPRQPIDQRMTNTIEALKSSDGFLWLYVAVCFAAALLRRSWPAFLAACIAVTWPAVLFMIIGIVFKPNFLHIVWPLYAAAALAGATMVFAQDPVEHKGEGYLSLEDRAVAPVVVLGTLALAAVQIQSMFEKGAASSELRRQIAVDLSSWPVRERDMVVVRSNNFPFEIWVQPFHPVPRAPWRFVHTGHSSASPLFQPIYSQWGTSDIAWAICNVPGVSVVDARKGYAEAHANQLTIHMRDHYRQSVTVNSAFEGEALSLYVCIKEGMAGGRLSELR